MIREINIQHEEIYPEGEWRMIANERDYDRRIDDDIYFYVEDSLDMSSLKIGDIIELDEPFKIVDLD